MKRLITTDGITEAAQAINSIMKHITYELNGQQAIIPITKKEVKDNMILVYGYIDDEVQGNLSEFKLISISGKVFANKVNIIAKPNTKGLLIRFKFILKEGQTDV